MSLQRFPGSLPGRLTEAGGSNWGLLALILAVVVIGGFLARELLFDLPTPESTAPTGTEVSGKAAQEMATPSSDLAQPAPTSSADASASRHPEAKKAGVVAGTTAAGVAPALPSAPPLSGEMRPEPAAAEFDLAHAQSLVKFLAEFKPGKEKLTAADLKAIADAIDELKRMGLAGVVAIDQYLQTGGDVDLAALMEKPNPAYSSLRVALLEALAEIGGADAADAMARTLTSTVSPREISVLARGLEGYAPELYRPEIADAVRATLTEALQSEPGKFRDLSYLFGVMQDYGDDTVAAELDEIYRTGKNAWAEQSMMALSDLPEGQGAPYLVGMANEMAADPNRNDSRYTMALRMLAQASRESPEAANALLGLAQAGKVSTPALVSVAKTLGGTEYQLITPSSPLAEVSNAATALNGRAPETWTDAQIDQRIGMVDQLLTYGADPASVKALNEARDRLLVWKARPTVNGQRITQ